MFVRSNLHDTFLHSTYRQQFQKSFGKDTRYARPGAHHNVSAYAEDLVNLETRAFESSWLGNKHGNNSLSDAIEVRISQPATAVLGAAQAMLASSTGAPRC